MRGATADEVRNPVGDSRTCPNDRPLPVERVQPNAGFEEPEIAGVRFDRGDLRPGIEPEQVKTEESYVPAEIEDPRGASELPENRPNWLRERVALLFEDLVQHPCVSASVPHGDAASRIPEGVDARPGGNRAGMRLAYCEQTSLSPFDKVTRTPVLVRGRAQP